MKTNNIFKSFITLLMGCTLVFTSCQEEGSQEKKVEPVFPELQTDTNVAPGSEITLEFEVNMDWTLSISDENMRWFWIVDNSFKVDKISGKVASNGVAESVTVNIGVADNQEFDNNRECELTLTMGGQSQVIARYMRPAKNRTLKVCAAKMQDGTFVKNDNGAYEYDEAEVTEISLVWSETDADFRMPVKIESNFNWTIAAPEWLKFQEPENTEGFVELVFTAMSLTEVSGKIDFKVKGAEDALKTIDVTAPSCGGLSVYTATKDEEGEFIFGEDGGYVYSAEPVESLTLMWLGQDYRMPVKIESKCNWTAECPKWMTMQLPEEAIGNTRGTVLCTLFGDPLHYPFEDATADVTFSFDGLTLSTLSVTIPGVKDKFSYGVDMNMTSWEFNPSGELLTSVGYQKMPASAWMTGTNEACVVAVEMSEGKRVADNPEWLKVSLTPYVIGDEVLQTRNVTVEPEVNAGEKRHALVLFCNGSYNYEDWFTSEGALKDEYQQYAVTLVQNGSDMDYITMLASESSMASAGAAFSVSTNPRLETWFGATKYKYELVYSNQYASDQAHMSLAKPYASYKVFNAARQNKTSDTSFWLQFVPEGDSEDDSEGISRGVITMYKDMTAPVEGISDGYVVFYDNADNDNAVLAIVKCTYNPVVVVEEVVVEFTQESAMYAPMVGATLEKLTEGDIYKQFYEGMYTVYHLTYKTDVMPLKIKLPASVKKHNVNPYLYKKYFMVNNLVYDEYSGPNDLRGEVELDDEGAVEIYMSQPDTVVQIGTEELPAGVYRAAINFTNLSDEVVFVLVCTLDLSE